ncbi:Component of a membrane-bound complex containing the Tor2p kinase [Knufia obscura]|uniref:Component of a membrane-bound complex containing the Tor2p kinase n=2 Tax=Knufia TaxID=430999 RepID=A0AAN8EQX7_9EURO|nr:Component of a membrane-bound complex containing the Tor2p kinase [Knufia obscura]KAK5956813.1 Component of a membrane-bound complex containing the Tor2p kinase [Knufia fluminis]
MALSQQEDFAIWYLRTTYLNSCKDGIGDRLINVNSSILNTPGFRAAGWTTDAVQPTYSPPIPTAINTEYFQAGGGGVLLREESRDDDEDEGGMVTGRKSNDTVGPRINVKRRRRREQIDDDDSSDLSDESDDDEGTTQRAAQQIKFAKMPARDQPGSSPMKATESQERPDVMVTSPSKPDGRKRGGSLGAVEAVKARARADTTTSSDMSSENELDPSYFQRRQISAPKAPKSVSLADALKADPSRTDSIDPQDVEADDSDGDSVDSAASSELGQTVDSADLLNTMGGPNLQTSSPILAGVRQAEIRSPSESPKKMKSLPALQALPPPRPISMIKPVSLLSQALKAQTSTSNPIQRYAGLSGKGSPNPLWIKVYAPFSEDPEDPFEMPLMKTSKDGEPVIVAEAIGLSLWRYCEEKLKPELKPEQLNVNKWVLRLVEDGEVEYDFPPLSRTGHMSDFTMNNNRGARGRSRGRAFDEFALVEASSREFAANEKETPMFSPTKAEMLSSEPQPQQQPSTTGALAPPPLATRGSSRSNPLLAGQPFASALANTGLTPADKPAPMAMTSTPRLGTTKTVRVKYFDLDTIGQTTKVEISTDSYIAEILDLVCRRWNLDKAGFVLKVAGTNTVAALDRTVEALGTRSDLDLVRKRFGAGPSNLTGSPGSASPNAPLLLDIQGPTGKDKKGKKGQKILHPLAQKQDMMASASNFKKYYVTRRRVTSFSQSSARVLVFDGDMLHNMPADTGKTMIDSNAKTNSFAFADVMRCKISSKHSKLVRLFVRRGTETKRYDFEARTAGEAQEIVDEITKEMKLARG